MYTKLFYAASLLKKSFQVPDAMDNELLRKRVDFASYVVEICIFLNLLNIIPLLKISGVFEWVKGQDVLICVVLFLLTWMHSWFFFLRKGRGIVLLRRMDERYKNQMLPVRKIVWGTLIVNILLVVVLIIVAKAFF